MKLCIDTRDELQVVDLSKVVCVRAEGNYCKASYMSGENQLLNFNLARMESYIERAAASDKEVQFMRLGRSLIINHRWVVGINLLRQELLMSDYEGHSMVVPLPKAVLRQYKNILVEMHRK